MASRNISAVVQIGAVMASNVRTVFGGLNKYIDGLGDNLAKVKKASGDITRLQAAQARLSKAQASGNTAAIAKQQQAVDKLTASLRAQGVDTSRLTHEQERLNAALARGSTRLGQFTRLNSSLGNLSTAFAGAKMQVIGLTTKLTALGVAGAYGFKKGFLDVAAEFERLQTVLKTLEGGDVNKAKQSFGWISKFAAETPYDLKGVTEAFVKLRAYGIDPIKGDTLRVLGDTSAAMGKDLMQAVEAMADAITGENERLKEFGIKASKEKNKITYEYTNRAGKQIRKQIDGSNRELIRSTLAAIWNEKYAGAMLEQSKTWKGMMSNLGDQWDRFASTVMAGGLFDWMKGELGSILKELDAAAADGRLKAWAKETGEAIKGTFIAMKDFAIATKDATIAVKDFVGGWRNLGIIVAGVALAPTIASVVSLTRALWSLGAAVIGVTGPWGWLIAAIIGGAALIYTHWEPIKAFMVDTWTTITDQVSRMWRSLTTELQIGLEKLRRSFVDTWDGIKGSITSAVDWIVGKIDYLISKFNQLTGLNMSLGGSMKLTAAESAQAGIPTGGGDPYQMMPADKMPSARGGSVTNNVDVKIDARGSDGDEIADKLRGALSNRPLFDQQSVLVPQ